MKRKKVNILLLTLTTLSLTSCGIFATSSSQESSVSTTSQSHNSGGEATTVIPTIDSSSELLELTYEDKIAALEIFIEAFNQHNVRIEVDNNNEYATSDEEIIIAEHGLYDSYSNSSAGSIAEYRDGTVIGGYYTDGLETFVPVVNAQVQWELLLTYICPSFYIENGLSLLEQCQDIEGGLYVSYDLIEITLADWSAIFGWIESDISFDIDITGVTGAKMFFENILVCELKFFFGEGIIPGADDYYENGELPLPPSPFAQVGEYFGVEIPPMEAESYYISETWIEDLFYTATFSFEVYLDGNSSQAILDWYYTLTEAGWTERVDISPFELAYSDPTGLLFLSAEAETDDTVIIYGGLSPTEYPHGWPADQLEEVGIYDIPSINGTGYEFIDDREDNGCVVIIVHNPEVSLLEYEASLVFNGAIRVFEDPIFAEGWSFVFEEWQITAYEWEASYMVILIYPKVSLEPEYSSVWPIEAITDVVGEEVSSLFPSLETDASILAFIDVSFGFLEPTAGVHVFSESTEAIIDSYISKLLSEGWQPYLNSSSVYIHADHPEVAITIIDLLDGTYIIAIGKIYDETYPSFAAGFAAVCEHLAEEGLYYGTSDSAKEEIEIFLACLPILEEDETPFTVGVIPLGEAYYQIEVIGISEEEAYSYALSVFATIFVDLNGESKEFLGGAIQEYETGWEITAFAVMSDEISWLYVSIGYMYDPISGASGMYFVVRIW